MRLLLNIGYIKVLFPKDVQVGLLLEAIGNGVVVEDKGYGDTRKLVPSDSTRFLEAEFLQDDARCLPDISQGVAVEKLLAYAQELTETKAELHRLQQDFAAATKKAELPQANG